MGKKWLQESRQGSKKCQRLQAESVVSTLIFLDMSTIPKDVLVRWLETGEKEHPKEQPPTLALKLATTAAFLFGLFNLADNISINFSSSTAQLFAESNLLLSCLIATTLTVSLTVLWHHTQSNKIWARPWLTIVQNFVRLWLAYSISVYGFAKLLKTQLQNPPYRSDMLLGETPGFSLTWYYFGYSETMVVILASFQIGGSILLLYRRTALMGVAILLPVMANIVLINIFYDINLGAMINAIAYLFGLLYLTLLSKAHVTKMFRDAASSLPTLKPVRPAIRHVLSCTVIGFAFLTIFIHVTRDKSDKLLTGVWRVRSEIRNGELLSANAWESDTTVVSRVYFAGAYGSAFCPNPFFYKWKQSLRGSYSFNSETEQLVFAFVTREGLDTLRARVVRPTHEEMILEGVLRGDKIRLNMKLERSWPEK
jgi:hypothetical protein